MESIIILERNGIMRTLVSDPQKLPIRFRLGDASYNGMPEDTKTEQKDGKILYTAMLGTLEIKAVCVRSGRNAKSRDWISF